MTLACQSLIAAETALGIRPACQAFVSFAAKPCIKAKKPNGAPTFQINAEADRRDRKSNYGRLPIEKHF
jgi:hypothetical protein